MTRFFMLPSNGIVPVKLFEERSRNSINEALDKELGIGPQVYCAPSRVNCLMLGRVRPILEGSFPTSLFCVRDR